MGQVAGGGEDHGLEVGLEGEEAAHLLDGRHHGLLAPDEERGLDEAAEGVADVDVELLADECGGSVLGARLVRGAVVDVHHLVGDQAVVGVRGLEEGADRAVGDEAVEDGRADDRRVHRDAREVSARTRRPAESHDPRGADEHESRKAPRVARAEDDGVGGGERRGDEGAGLRHHLTREVRQEGEKERRRIAQRRALGATEAEQVDRVDRVAPGEGLDVVAPLVRRGGGVQPVDEEQRRAAAAHRIGDAVATPLEPAVASADQVLERADVAAREVVERRRGADRRAAAHQKLAPLHVRNLEESRDG